MSDIDYGKLTKRIVFTDTDHRHAQLILRLKHDSMSQANFFRHLITGYLSQDERIVSFIDERKDQSKVRKSKTNKLRAKGAKTLDDFGFSNKEIDNIFDLIEEEHPDL